MTASRKPPISASRKFQENDNIVTWTEMHVMIHLYRRSETQLACILEASDSTRMRKEESVPNHHEDHIAGKGDNSPQAMKIPAAKAAVDMEWENWRKFWCGT